MIRRIAGPLRGIAQRILDLTAIACAYKIFTQKFYNIQPCFGPSMYPTLHFNGDLLLVSKLHKHGKGVEVGDVVVFRYPFFFRSDTCKRVLGMPGDFVLRGKACAQEPLEVGEDADMTQVWNRPFFPSHPDHFCYRDICYCSADGLWPLGSRGPYLG